MLLLFRPVQAFAVQDVPRRLMLIYAAIRGMMPIFSPYVILAQCHLLQRASVA